MSDVSPRSPRTPLHRTVLRLAGASAASAALVWSGLFYGALQRHAAATAQRPAAVASSGTAQSKSSPAAQQPAPVVTRTS